MPFPRIKEKSRRSRIRKGGFHFFKGVDWLVHPKLPHTKR
ncbi:hypothetical protein HMPREF9374_1274 [Desmospora sp. 8437]|nr:hypothetical protein HMPREF9374_1274 [Desmospora sp. 8437]